MSSTVLQATYGSIMMSTSVQFPYDIAPLMMLIWFDIGLTSNLTDHWRFCTMRWRRVGAGGEIGAQQIHFVPP